MSPYTSLQPDPRGIGGLSVARSISLLNTGVAAVKAAPGSVYGWHVRNNSAAATFLKLYDKASAAASTDTPLLTIAVSAAGMAEGSFPHGIRFPTGIAWRACTGVADADNTAPSANDVVANLFYA